MNSILIVIGLSVFFYLFIPGLGAVFARRKWRIFRKRIITGSLYPRMNLNTLRNGEDIFRGNFRFFGMLQAIEGDHVIWLGDGKNTVSAELFNVDIYILPPSDSMPHPEDIIKNRALQTGDMPRRIRWSALHSLPEGTRFFLSGPLFFDKRKPVFRSEKDNQLLVVIYDGKEQDLLNSSIWAARQRNEYWNSITYPSMAAGFLSCLIYSYSLVQNSADKASVIFAISACLIPVLSFLPPGVAFLYLYRYLWKEGRIYRAERDLVKLPLRYFAGSFGNGPHQKGSLPDGKTYIAVKVSREEREKNNKGKDMPGSIPVSAVPSKASVDYGYIFGEEDGLGNPGHPDDPMASYVFVPGNPVKLSRTCRLKARTMEILSIASFSLGFFLNLFILIYFLSLFIN